MNIENNPGLGELLRHLIELIDNEAAELYRQELLNYRPQWDISILGQPAKKSSQPLKNKY